MAKDNRLNPSGGEPTIWVFDVNNGPQLITSAAAKNKTDEGFPRRFYLRNAFEQVYPHGG